MTRAFHRRNGLIGLFLLVIIALVLSGWANTWKRELRVEKVRVVGNRYVTTQEILTAAAVPRHQNLFDVDLFEVQQRVLTNSFLKSASVRREPPAQLLISVDERVPLAALMVGGISYLDEEGWVLPPLRVKEVLDVPVLTSPGRVEGLHAGKRVSSPDVLEALRVVRIARRINDQLYRQISEVRVGGKQELMFYTAEAGVPVLVGHDNIGVKLVQFESFWKQFVDPRGPGELQYVDLRFQDQVVAKWKTASGQEASSQQQGV